MLRMIARVCRARRTNRWPAPLLAAPVLLLASACGNSSETEFRDPDEFFFTQTFGDLREEAATARSEGKLGMLLFFKSDACPYCLHMHHKVLSDRKVQEWYSPRFTSIAVDIHGDVELTDFDGITLPSKVFSDHRQIFWTPVVAFLDLDGNELYRYPGMIRTSEEMLLVGEYIEGGHYLDLEYRIFAAQRGMTGDSSMRTPGETAE